MAGIGFVLRRLTRRGDLTGTISAYFHAIFASSGPWLLTIFAVWAFFFIGEFWRLTDMVEEFRTIVLYNFSFSLVLTSPIVMISTRYLADCIFREDVEEASSLLIGGLVVQFFATLPLALFFYFQVVTLSPLLAILSVINFLLISGIWLSMVFISSLKYYSGITWSFVMGMLLGGVSAYFLTGEFGAEGLTFGFDVGLGFILASFIALILTEYPHKITSPFRFLKYLKNYWQVGLAGTFYNLAIWVDKWIMWFSPERRVLESGLVTYPEYDISMFIAYLTIIPALALFLLAEETSFFRTYVRFYRGVLQHDPLSRIEKNHNKMMQNIMTHGRNLIILQGTICVITLFTAPGLLEFLNLNLLQLSIFRFAVVGASFQVMVLVFIILLSYFDNRRDVLIINAVFFFTNMIFTLITLQIGFPAYGSGFTLSTVVSFFVAAVIAERYMRRLPYHTFITRNIVNARMQLPQTETA